MFSERFNAMRYEDSVGGLAMSNDSELNENLKCSQVMKIKSKIM